MSRHDSKPPEGLITSDAVRGVRHFSRRLWLGAGAVILIGAAVTAGVYMYPKLRPTPPAPSAAVQKSSRLSLRPDQAVAAAQTDLQAAKTSQQKAAAYVSLGTAYMNNNQAKQAMEAYQQALAADNTDVAALTALGNAYYAAGQKDQAVSTFQKLVDVLQQSNDPMLHTQAAQYQKVIQQLQNGGTL